jgi:hypothetical protein
MTDDQVRQDSGRNVPETPRTEVKDKAGRVWQEWVNRITYTDQTVHMVRLRICARGKFVYRIDLTDMNPDEVDYFYDNLDIP